VYQSIVHPVEGWTELGVHHTVDRVPGFLPNRPKLPSPPPPPQVSVAPPPIKPKGGRNLLAGVGGSQFGRFERKPGTLSALSNINRLSLRRHSPPISTFVSLLLYAFSQSQPHSNNFFNFLRRLAFTFASTFLHGFYF